MEMYLKRINLRSNLRKRRNGKFASKSDILYDSEDVLLQ